MARVAARLGTGVQNRIRGQHGGDDVAAERLVRPHPGAQATLPVDGQPTHLWAPPRRARASGTGAVTAGAREPWVCRRPLRGPTARQQVRRPGGPCRVSRVVCQALPMPVQVLPALACGLRCYASMAPAWGHALPPGRAQGE
jgi:hypothetical protein